MTPDQLGPYRVERELGAGGMGRVFAAVVEGRCPGLDVGTRVALKVVHPHLLETEGFFKRFLREAQIGQSVLHENVVRTLDCDAIGAEHFLVMEYVEGQDLRELLDELDLVPEELCRHVGREIAKGLAAIHAVGVVHRDLKPENVLITPDHVVKVMDLGVARLQDEAVRLSQTGAFVGSLHYAAPEAFRGGGADVDGRADLHALGLLLYELACGTNPYLADDVPQTLRKVLHEEPRRLGDVNPQLSPFFEEVVHCLLAKDREQRFTSAGTLLSVLEDGEESTWWRERAKALRVETNRPLRRIRIPRETAVYGREKELDRLRGMFEQAKSGDGQVVLIEGEAGIGKSRLVDELVGRLHADGEDLNFLFGSYPPGGASTASGGFSSAYRDHFGEAGSAAYLAQTPLLVPAFDAVLRGEPAPSGVVELTKDSLGTCFVHATRNVAADRPTVVLIDDLHFAPEEARALFSSVALAAPGHRVLLIGTMRPGVPEDWVANVSRLDHCSHMDVPRLGPKDLAQLLKDSFRSQQLAEQLAFQIGTKSDGNPFFAFEIIRGLREGQFITQKDDGTWVSTRVVDDIQIPSSVLDLVNARVAGLSEDERALLDVAACWGYEFDPGLIGDVLGMARIPSLRSFGQVERLHRLVRSSGRGYVFDHHQVQEALYGSINEQLREEYHAALAQVLETRTKAVEKDPESLDGALCVDLCEHYLKGARSEDALRYLRAAQAHLTKGYLHAQMAALTERALAVPNLLAGIERAKTLLRLAAALDPMGRRARQEETAREAERLAEEAGDDHVHGRATLALGTLFWRTSRYSEAEARVRLAFDLARIVHDHETVAGAAVNLGLVLVSQGRLSEAQEQLERGVILCREIGHHLFEANATVSLGNVLYSQGRLRDAQERFELAWEIYRGLDLRAGEVAPIGNLGLVFAHRGEWAEAQRHQERALTLCREIGDRQHLGQSTGALGEALYCQGRLDAAQKQFERALAIYREVGYQAGEASATCLLGDSFLCQGRLADARRQYEESLALCRAIRHRELEAGALHRLGLMLCEGGESEAGEATLRASLALCDEIGHRNLAAHTRLALGTLRAATSGGQRGRRALAAARDAAREHGFPGVEVLARCELARLPGGDAHDALAALSEHEERLSAEERREARLLLWRATDDRAHLERGKRLLDESLANVPEEYHASMCQNLRVNREILAACEEQGL